MNDNLARAAGAYNKAIGHENRPDIRLADEYACNPHSIRRAAGELRSRALPTADAHKTKELPRLKSTLMFPPPALGERLDTFPRFVEARAIVAGDVHAATHDHWLFARMCEVGRRYGVDNLYIIGDMWNGEADSTFDPHGGEVSRAREFAIVAALIRYALQSFSHIYMTPGNHLRKRLMKTLRADIDMTQIVRLITDGDDDQRVTLFPQDILEIVSGGHSWVCTHQYQYSINKLVVARKLALRYQANIIAFHQHHTAIGRDDFDRYTVIDCGGLHSHAHMAYIHTVPSTRNVPNNGFVFLEDGTAHLLTPYPTMTRWQRWGFEEAV